MDLMWLKKENSIWNSERNFVQKVNEIFKIIFPKKMKKILSRKENPIY